MTPEKKGTKEIEAQGLPSLSITRTKSCGDFITEAVEISSSGLSMKETIDGFNYLLDKPLKKIQEQEADK